jgi:hypothetical protein
MGMRSRLLIAPLIALAIVASACSSPGVTRVTATVAGGEEPADGLGPGDPVANGALRLYAGDDLILETVLDTEGTTEISVEPGVYTLQVMTPSGRPGCFWGTTATGIDLPGDPLAVEVFFICSG